jgi:hypothetical protein
VGLLLKKLKGGYFFAIVPALGMAPLQSKLSTMLAMILIIKFFPLP